MLLLAEAGRTLNKDLTSLFRHNLQTPHVLDRLVHELHSDKELCSYLFLNHPGSEDMLWGLMNLLMEDSRWERVLFMFKWTSENLKGCCVKLSTLLNKSEVGFEWRANYKQN